MSARTALMIVTPTAAVAAHPWLERTCGMKPSQGVPAHVTILFPFVPAGRIDRALLAHLRRLFERFDPFRFELRTPRRFPGVLYLAPEPPEPFVALTEAVVASYPEHPPYGGVFAAIVPHVTVAEGNASVLDDAEQDVRRLLPIRGEATEVLLLAEEGTRWEPAASVPLGRSPNDPAS